MLHKVYGHLLLPFEDKLSSAALYLFSNSCQLSVPCQPSSHHVQSTCTRYYPVIVLTIILINIEIIPYYRII